MRKTVFAVATAVFGFLAGQALPAAADDKADEKPADVLSLAGTRELARRYVPPRRDPDGWANDVWEGLVRNAILPRQSNVCAVLAVIGQESGFTANPEVKGLGPMAEREIAEKIRDVPVLPGAVAEGVSWFLDNRPSPEKSYMSLIRAAKTERDLDLVYRNMAFYLFREYATTALLNTPAVARRVDAANPVKTVGAMQVSVAFAQSEVEKAAGKRLQMNAIWKLRDELYTRAGGVAYGARMLLGYYAGYGSRLYVFADYNAGRFASRNAAFQSMVAALSGKPLALDGDLLLYDAGEASSKVSATESALQDLKLGLTGKALRADLLREKEFGFRETTTYKLVAERYAFVTGKPAPYAAMPQIRLSSPKLSHTMTTEKFARSVMARYEKCLALD